MSDGQAQPTIAAVHTVRNATSDASASANTHQEGV